MKIHHQTCWLFCTVIDNFGDIGVSWRLAQQLHTRLGWNVHLWLDDVSTLRAIVPDVADTLPCIHQNIHLHHWHDNVDNDVQAACTPHIVIETFACDLPATVIDIIQKNQVIWLNWEYLSAEDWAVRTHTMPSLQSNGCHKYFWQMGFVPQSGGLLREADYVTRQQHFHTTHQHDAGSLHIFAFGYASPVWEKWCATLATLDVPITLHIAGSPIFGSLHQSGYTSRPDAHEHHAGCLHIVPQDFVPQAQFDTLLWAADWLIVRGEDSFVRAQLSGKPFFWHIYPQDERAHLDKLDAFWQLVWQNDNNQVQAAHTALSGELNDAHQLNDAERAAHFTTLLQQQTAWQTHAHAWQQRLLAQDDAVSRLANWLVNIPSSTS